MNQIFIKAALFALTSYINPFVFFFLIFISPENLENSFLFYTIKTQSNTGAIYLPYYLPVSMLIFSVITAFNYLFYLFMYRKRADQKPEINNFFDIQLKSQIPYSPYLIMHLVFLIGMEGNIFGFIFLPLAIIALPITFLASLFIFIYSIRKQLQAK